MLTEQTGSPERSVAGSSDIRRTLKSQVADKTKRFTKKCRRGQEEEEIDIFEDQRVKLQSSGR